MYKFVSDLEREVLQRIQEQDFNAALNLLCSFVNDVWKSNLAVANVFGSQCLDALCERIGSEVWIHEPKIQAEKEAVESNRDVIIATELYRAGGHTAVIEEIISVQPEKMHKILLTNIFETADRASIEKRFSNANVSVEYAPDGPLLEKLRWLQSRLVILGPSRTFLFNHHQDAVAIAAIHPELNSEVIFYHHADHHLCLGVFLTTAIHVDPHNLGFFNCRNQLGLERNVYWPLAVRDRGPRPPELLFLGEGALRTCTSGNRYKLERPYQYSYAEEVPNLLEVTGGVHLHIGDLSDDAVQAIQDGLEKRGIAKERFVLIPWVQSLWDTMIEQRVDLYISSFPLGGGLAGVEVMGSATPMVVHESYLSRFHGGGDLVYPEAFNWKTVSELLEFVQRLTPDKLKQQSLLARRHYERYYSIEELKRALSGSTNLTPLPLRRYTPDMVQRYLDQESHITELVVANVSQAVAERDAQIASLSQGLADRDKQDAERNGQIAERDGQIAERDRQIAEREGQIRVIVNSRSWKLTRPLRGISVWARTVRSWFDSSQSVSTLARIGQLYGAAIVQLFRKVVHWVRHNRRLPTRREMRLGLYRIKHLMRSNGKHAGLVVPHGFVLPHKLDPYQAWLDVNRFTAEDAKNLRARLEVAGSALPRISVVMPVYNPNPKFLDEAIRSVINQIYGNWELCIADDASTDDDVLSTILRWQKADDSIRVIRREINGNISVATNDASGLATGEFLAFLDHDDVLTPDALGEVALALSANPEADLLYSDDDKIDQYDNRFAPQFKPDWSPELLLSYMYWSHLVAVRRSLFTSLGGMRPGFEGSQDYDFILRASERARHIIHLPYVLYHWRVVPGSTAMSGHAKPASFDAGRLAVHETLVRRGINAVVVQPDWAMREGLGIYRPVFPDYGPSITIIIPTKNGWKLLDRCLQSLKKTSYSNYTVLIVDNGSDDDSSLRYLASLEHEVIRVPNPGLSFNFAYVNNRAVSQVQSDYVLFLNNDTEVVSPDWLSVMAGYAQLDGVGAVGSRLLYPDQRVQHAGIVHGLYDGLAGPAFKLLPSWHHGYLARACVAQNTGAVTAACMLTPRQLFLKLGGFDEANFAVAYNDVDYCYRLNDAGYRCVVADEIQLIHHEGLSRGFDDNPREVAAFKQKYRQRVDHYYNPNLSLDDEQFAVRRVRNPRGTVGSPVRVFMCAHNLNWEGAPYSQLEMTVALTERGVIAPIVFSSCDGPLRAEYERRGISVVVRRDPLTGILTREEYENAISEFAELIRQHHAEVVYGNTLQTFYAIDAADRLNIASVWNIRESEPWQAYFSYLADEVAVCALSCYSKPYRAIFVSNATRRENDILNTANNFSVIHNGINLARLHESCTGVSRCGARSLLGIEERDVSILLLGTVCERKGQKDLVHAAELLHRKGCSGFRIFIVGDREGEYSRELHEMASKFPDDVRSKVNIVPETNTVAPYWMAADIFVCSSRVESYPRVTLEAMAIGLPIVTTGVFGISEQVREGRNAFIYDPGDTAALAAYLEKLIVKRNLRETFGMASKEVLACLTLFDDMVEAYGRVFVEAREVRLV